MLFRLGIGREEMFGHLCEGKQDRGYPEQGDHQPLAILEKWGQPKVGGFGLVLDGFIVSQIPNVDRGLVAYDYFGRQPAVRALRDLMVSWKGCPEAVRTAPLGFHQRQADELEALVVPSYCQLFFNTFGRMPVPPPRLPYISTTREEPRSVTAAALNQV